MEEEVFKLQQAGVAVELLTGRDAAGVFAVGVRLRTFGKLAPRDKMVICRGDTYSAALEGAVQRAQARRWEPLDWGKRPWATAGPGAGADGYGL